MEVVSPPWLGCDFVSPAPTLNPLAQYPCPGPISRPFSRPLLEPLPSLTGSLASLQVPIQCQNLRAWPWVPTAPVLFPVCSLVWKPGPRPLAVIITIAAQRSHPLCLLCIFLVPRPAPSVSIETDPFRDDHLRRPAHLLLPRQQGGVHGLPGGKRPQDPCLALCSYCCVIPAGDTVENTARGRHTRLQVQGQGCVSSEDVPLAECRGGMGQPPASTPGVPVCVCTSCSLLFTKPLGSTAQLP